MGKKHLSGRNKSLILILAATGSVVVIIVLFELYARMTSPYIIRVNTPGVSGVYSQGDYSYYIDSVSGRRLIPNSNVIIKNHFRSGLDVPININSDGFRGSNIEKEKKGKRIIVLGDSITLADDQPIDNTFVYKVESILKNKRDVQVINAGADGIGTKDEIDILEQQGLKLKPDMVVVAFYLNDLNLPDRFAACLANPGFIRRNSVLAETIYRAYKKRQYENNLQDYSVVEWTRFDPPPDIQTNREAFLRYAASAEKDWGVAWQPGKWRVIEEQFDRLNRLSREYDFQVVVVSFPVIFQTLTDYTEDYPQRNLETLSVKNRFFFHDLLPAFRENINSMPIFTDWCHLTTSGHDLVAKNISPFLEFVISSKDAPPPEAFTGSR
ncbi:SGNH/GDSL hydrolase family protein [bacterium]|nr:MAG: SGNH/GDSL hydrolase family protein [bacterium]